MNGTAENTGNKRNTGLLYAHTILTGITSFVVTGGILQTFLLEYGMTESRVSLAVALFQIAQAAAMLLFSGRLEQVKGLLKVNKRLLILVFPMLASMGVISILGSSPEVTFPLLLVTGILTYGGIGLTGTMAYKIPYVLIDMEDYGHLSGIQGTLSGLLCMTLAAAMPVLLGRFSYKQIAPFLPLAGTAALVLTWVVLAAMKEEHEPPKVYGGRIALLRYPPFVKTILPNLARGFGSGILCFMTTIGYHAEMIDNRSASVMVFITYATSMLGCFVFSKVTSRERDRKVILVCGIALAVLMPFLIIKNSLALFFVIFTLCQFFRAIMDVAIPASLVPIMDYRAVIQCAAWRIALYMAAASLAVSAAIPMVDAIGYAPTFLIAGLMNLYSCVGYSKLTRQEKEKSQ